LKRFKAIAAMAENRVIGADNKIPWHLPEDFKWFKQMTTGHIIIMGRKTFESIGKPLPNRTTIVLSRSSDRVPAGIRRISNLHEIDPATEERDVYICGGAQVYAQALPVCSDLYLTLVKRSVPGDSLFPPFEHQFGAPTLILDHPSFKILHYRNAS
jgi:dihydrofolate reductase